MNFKYVSDEFCPGWSQDKVVTVMKCVGIAPDQDIDLQGAELLGFTYEKMEGGIPLEDIALCFHQARMELMDGQFQGNCPRCSAQSLQKKMIVVALLVCSFFFGQLSVGHQWNRSELTPEQKQELIEALQTQQSPKQLKE